MRRDLADQKDLGIIMGIHLQGTNVPTRNRCILTNKNSPLDKFYPTVRFRAIADDFHQQSS